MILMCISLRNLVSGYSNPNYPHVGRKCPCFCSARSGDGASPYWDIQFGAEVGNAKCNTTTCLDIDDYAKYMPFCKDVITYKFCPRQFDKNYLNLKGVELLSSLDTHAKTCHDESMSDPDKILRKSSEEMFDKCKANVKKGACYIAFPGCTNNLATPGKVKPLGVCTSFCKHERESCRAENSFIGDQRAISESCSELPWIANARWSNGGKGGTWVVDKGSSDICVGPGTSVSENISIFVIFFTSIFSAWLAVAI